MLNSERSRGQGIRTAVELRCSPTKNDRKLAYNNLSNVYLVISILLEKRGRRRVLRAYCGDAFRYVPRQLRRGRGEAWANAHRGHLRDARKTRGVHRRERRARSLV